MDDAARPPHHLVPVETRKAEIDERHVETHPREHVYSGRTIARFEDLMAGELQSHPHHFARVVLVLDDEDASPVAKLTTRGNGEARSLGEWERDGELAA